MKIRTDRGRMYDAAWIGGPTSVKEEVYAEIADTRPISVIAAEFEGAQIVRVGDDGEEYPYTGYTELARIERERDSEYTRIAMRRPKEG